MNGLKADSRSIFEIAPPSILEDPGVQCGFPARPLGENVPLQAEGVRLQFVDMHVDHDPVGGLEVLVVVDPRGTRSEDPFAIRTQVCLGGPALDLRADRILGLVRVRNDVVIEREQTDAQHRSRPERPESRVCTG